MDISVLWVGAAVGVLVGLTSMGGGSLLTPALILVAGVPPSIAIGSDLVVASGLKLVGGGAYAIRRSVRWAIVGRLALGSVPGALAGVLLLNQIPGHLVDSFVARALGWILVAAGAATLARFAIPRRDDRPEPAIGWTVLIGFATGLLVGVTSVGSGSLLLAALAFFYPLRSRELVGTDLAHAFLLTSAATVGHLLSGRVDWNLVIAALAGGIPGVLLGTKLASSLSEQSLRAGLAALLTLIGFHFGTRGSGPAEPPAAALPPAKQVLEVTP